MADLRVFETEEERESARTSFDRMLADREAEIERQLDAAVAALRTPEDVARWQQCIRENLADLLGEFPAKRPLRPCVVGKIERRDIVIEKVLIESRPRYYVTANLYIPRGKPLPAPGVLVPCGHTVQGKATNGYHSAGMGLALKGYVAMVYDPTGQGERSECYNPKTRRHIVHPEVPQHHYTGKPLYFTNLTLAGWRTWDGLRCVDYLASRGEVDADRLAVMGNSGGGAMTMLVSCVDERIKACAASHPGGSMENTHLRGRRPPDRRLYSLMAPRPCRIIVGDASGEEANHRRKLDLMKPFYQACGCPDRLELVLVDGKHDLKLPKRAVSYEWLGRWLDHHDPSPEEPTFRRISEKRLNCTRTGQVLGSIKRTRTMQQINAARVEKLAPKRKAGKTPGALASQLNALRKRVSERNGFRAEPSELNTRVVGTAELDGVTVERLVFESEPGMPVPALLFRPDNCPPQAPVVVHTGEGGKPQSTDERTLPARLAQGGLPVLSVDVRDTGETSLCEIDHSDMWPEKGWTWRDFNGARWLHDRLAIRALSIGRSLPGMRALDVIRAVDLCERHDGLAGRPVLLAGEGAGGIWSMLAAALDERPAATVAIKALAAWRLITDNAEYNQFGHNWLPGALLDFDIPDLPALIAPRPVHVLDPLDQMSRRMTDRAARRTFRFARDVYRQKGAARAFHVGRTGATYPSLAKSVRELAEQLQARADGRQGVLDGRAAQE